MVSGKFSFDYKVRNHFDLLQAPHINGDILFHAKDQCRLSSKMFHKQTSIRSQMLVASEMRVNGFKNVKRPTTNVLHFHSLNSQTNQGNHF